MSKIICEVCGTTYPDTASQCPICGYVNPGTAGGTEDPAMGHDESYQHVKGGRFSKSNVRKRNKGIAVPVVHNTTTDKISREKSSGSQPPRHSGSGGAHTSGDDDKKSTALIVAAVIILLAIVAVVIFVSMHFFGPGSAVGTVPSTAESTVLPSETEKIPCQSITLDVSSIVFTKSGESRMLNVELSPADTTDAPIYSSSNEEVVVVSESGLVTAVGSGKATITITCGSAAVKSSVICDIPDVPEATTEASEPLESTETEETTEAAETTEVTEPENEDKTLKLNRKDMTFSHKGETWTLYEGTTAKENVKFSSADEKIVSFADGVVKAVGSGTTTVYAEFDGKKTSCIVRCAFSDPDAEPDLGGNGGGVSEDGEGNTQPAPTESAPTESAPAETGATEPPATTAPSIKLNREDMTMATKGETWTLYEGSVPKKDVVFRSADSKVATFTDGMVTAVGSGMTTVTAEYDGKLVSCIVRVR